MKNYKATGSAVALAVCMAAGMGAVGCNTFRGAGQDISAGGRGIQSAADRNQHNEREAHYHTIKATADQNGSITPSGDVEVAYRTEQTFRVSANRGYQVTDVMVDGRSIGAVSRYTFPDVYRDHSILVLFDPIQSR